MTLHAYHVVIDESGDSSLSTRGSTHFIIAASIVRSTKNLERCMRRLQKKVNDSARKKGGGKEVKAHSTRMDLKRSILECIAKTDVKIIYNYRNKILETEGNLNLYRDLLEYTIKDSLYAIPNGYKDVHILFDNTNKIKKTELDEIIAELNGNNGLNISYQMMSSAGNAALRAHDFIANAIFVNFERGDCELMDIIREKIIEGPGRMVTE